MLQDMSELTLPQAVPNSSLQQTPIALSLGRRS